MIKLTIDISNNPTKSYLSPTIKFPPLLSLVHQHLWFFWCFISIVSRQASKFSHINFGIWNKIEKYNQLFVHNAALETQNKHQPSYHINSPEAAWHSSETSISKSASFGVLVICSAHLLLPWLPTAWNIKQGEARASLRQSRHLSLPLFYPFTRDRFVMCSCQSLVCDVRHFWRSVLFLHCMQFWSFCVKKNKVCHRYLVKIPR